MIPLLGNEELWKAATEQGTQLGRLVRNGVWPGPPGSDGTGSGTGSGPYWYHLVEAVERLGRRNENLTVNNVPTIMFTCKYLLGISG